MKKTFISILALAAAAFAQFPGPPAAYPRMHSDTISDTALMLWQNPSYGGSASTKLKSMTFAQLAQGVGATIDSLAVTCGLGLNCDSTGTGKLVRQKNATLTSPTANWLKQTGKSNNGAPQIVGTGDSNMKGYPQDSIPFSMFMNLVLPFSPFVNLGVVGETAHHLDSIGAFVDSLYDPLVPNYLVVITGTNDWTAGYSAEQTYAAIASYLTARKNKGWRVIATTLTSRCGGYADFRRPLNNMIRQNWPQFADALADLGADPHMGQDNSCSDFVYFLDGTHYTVAGKRIVAEIIQNAVNSIYPQTLNVNIPTWGYGLAYMHPASDTIRGSGTNWTSGLVGSVIQWDLGATNAILKVVDSVTMIAENFNSADSIPYFPDTGAAYTISTAGLTVVSGFNPVALFPASSVGSVGLGTMNPSAHLHLKGNYTLDSNAIKISNNSATGDENNAGIMFTARSGFGQYSDMVGIYGGQGQGITTTADTKGLFKVSVKSSEYTFEPGEPARGMVERFRITDSGSTFIRGNDLSLGDVGISAAYPYSVFHRNNTLRFRNKTVNYNIQDMAKINVYSPDSLNGTNVRLDLTMLNTTTVLGDTSILSASSTTGNVTIGGRTDLSAKLGVKGNVRIEQKTNTPTSGLAIVNAAPTQGMLLWVGTGDTSYVWGAGDGSAPVQINNGGPIQLAGKTTGTDTITSSLGMRAPDFNTTGNAATGAGVMTTTGAPCASGSVIYIPHKYKGTAGYMLWCPAP